ncbi:MAG TPA: peptidyl-prolyl cis-trans isomerase, partial [Terriglobales bacterium]|nr:peptidyl-prolyl cis-trans isomerase [Terriglobales bacterium]
IGGQAITSEDVRRRLEELPETARQNFSTPTGRQQLLDRIIEERVWLIAAQQHGVAERPQVQQQLAQQRRDLLIRTYLGEVMAANPAPTDSEARVWYDSHAREYLVPATVTLRHIQTRTELKARQVLRLARAGQDWAKLALAYSTDSLTRRQGGALGAVTREGQFGSLGAQPALAESAFATGTGKIGGPFKTDRGWHVIKVDEIHAETTRPFETVRPMILRQLSNEKGQAFYRQRLDEVRRQLGVTPDSAAIRRFVSQKQGAREMFKAAQEIGPAADRIAAYRAVVAQYPDSEVSPQAQFMIGFIESEELKSYDQAEAAFRELLKRYPTSELAGSAQWMIDHMRSEDAPPFQISEADSSTTTPRPQGAVKGSSDKP